MMVKAFKAFFLSGSKQTYVAGILPSVLGLLLVFSLIFSQRLKNYRNDVRLYQQTKQFYQGKTIESMTVAKLQHRYGQQGAGLVLSGEDRYNIGTVTYRISEGEIQLQVSLDSGVTYLDKAGLELHPD